MSTLTKLRRPSEDATQEERRSYFSALRRALDEACIGFGDEFMVVNPGTPEPSGPAADDPAADGLGGFVRDSDTSRRAALDNFPRSGTQRAKLLGAIMEAGAGHTRDELCALFDMQVSSVNPRVKELLDGGWIEENEQTRKTRMGSDAAVLVATEKAQTHGT